MTGRQFEYKCRDGFVAWPITETCELDTKPYPKKKGMSVSIYRRGKEQVYFRTMQDAFQYVLDDGRKVIDVIESWEDMPDMELDGGIIWHYKKK